MGLAGSKSPQGRVVLVGFVILSTMFLHPYCFCLTFIAPDVIDQFYHELNQILDKIPPSAEILLLGDFNARVGTDHEGWDDVLGKHGVGNENSNGTA